MRNGNWLKKKAISLHLSFELLVEDFDTRVESRRMIQDGKGVCSERVGKTDNKRCFRQYVTPVIVQVAQFFGSRLVIPRDLTIWTDESLDITPYVLAQVNATIGDWYRLNRVQQSTGICRYCRITSRNYSFTSILWKVVMRTEIDLSLPMADLSMIKRMIPHRYPFLYIDKVMNLEKDKGWHRYQECNL